MIGSYRPRSRVAPYVSSVAKAASRPRIPLSPSSLGSSRLAYAPPATARMTVYAASRAGSVERNRSAGRVTERCRLPCLRSGRCRPAASRRPLPEGSGRSVSALWSLIGELLSRLDANAPSPVRAVHGPLAVWLNLAEQDYPRCRANTDHTFGRGDLTGRQDLGCADLTVDQGNVRGESDGGDLEPLAAESRPGAGAGRAAANVAINSQGRRVPADSRVLDADLRRQ